MVNVFFPIAIHWVWKDDEPAAKITFILAYQPRPPIVAAILKYFGEIVEVVANQQYNIVLFRNPFTALLLTAFVLLWQKVLGFGKCKT